MAIFLAKPMIKFSNLVSVKFGFHERTEIPHLADVSANAEIHKIQLKCCINFLKGAKTAGFQAWTTQIRTKWLHGFKLGSKAATGVSLRT